MAIAQGVYKQLIVKQQSGLGLLDTQPASGGRFMRRVTSTIDLAKETYKSNEILPSQQHRDMRHGVRSVAGTISGELSGQTYQPFMGGILRKAFVSNQISDASTNTMIARATSDNTGTFTDASATFVTDGWYVGMVVRFTGWAVHTAYGTATNATTSTSYSIGATSIVTSSCNGTIIAGDAIRFGSDTTDYIVSAVSGSTSAWTLTISALLSNVGSGATITIQTNASTLNNGHNFLITGLTETVMTVRSLDNVAISSKNCVIDNQVDVTLSACIGKYSYIPSSGHIENYYTIEHSYTDIDQSEVFTDCVPSQMNIKLPATGMATIDFPIIGLDMDVYSGSSAPFHTSPTSITTGGIYASVNGALYVNGSSVATITNMDISINGNVASMGGVVGTNVAPDIQFGTVEVTGSMSIFFENATIRNYFLNETEVALMVTLTTSSSSNADFMSIYMPRVKLGGATKDDGQKGLVMTVPFTALENTTAGSGIILSTIMIHDSLAA